MSLKLGRNLELPLDAVTQTAAFLGRRGSGKTYGATKLAELKLDAGAQIVALDPVGVWWGLRLNAARTGPSPFQIPVLGGRHGDIPLEAGAGKLIADLVVDRGTSIVLDVSMFESDADKARFAEAFASRFFFRKKEKPSAVHVFVEECQEFIPQNTQRGEERMLHAFNRMMKLGRNFGIGMSLISQRPQEVNKKTLNMSECLFAFQMTGIQERETIEKWAVDRGVDEDRKSLSERLPFLEVGTAHVWSPQWLQVSQDSHILKKQTADVSSTPKVGEAETEAKPLGAIDLAQLRDAMAATIAKAEAEDPAKLRTQIAALNRELAQARAQKPDAVPDDRAIERVVREATRQSAATVAALRKTLEAALKFIINVSAANFDVAGVDREQLESAVRAAVEKAQGIIDTRLADRARRLEQLRTAAQGIAAQLKTALGDEEVVIEVAVAKNEPFTVSGAPAPKRMASVEPVEGVTVPQQRILDALASFEALGIARVQKHNVAVFADQSPRSSGFANNLGRLRTLGLIDYPASGEVMLTDVGRAGAKAVSIESAVELHRAWESKLARPQWNILRVLIEAYPSPVDREALAAASDQSPTSSGYANNLGALRSLGLIDYRAGRSIVATSLLFPEGLA